MPSLTVPKYSTTAVKVAHSWVYCFGGNSGPAKPDQKYLEIERLDTASKNSSWTYLKIKCDYLGGC